MYAILSLGDIFGFHLLIEQVQCTTVISLGTKIGPKNEECDPVAKAAVSNLVDVAHPTPSGLDPFWKMGRGEKLTFGMQPQSQPDSGSSRTNESAGDYRIAQCSQREQAVLRLGWRMSPGQ